MKAYSLVVALLLALIVAPFAQPADRTTAPTVYVTVHVTLNGSKVSVTPKTAPQGSDLRLQVVNTSSKPQRLSFDYTQLAGGRHTGFDLVFKPHSQRIFLLALEVEARLPYFSGTTFDKTSGAKRGVFIVGPQCAECSQ